MRERLKLKFRVRGSRKQGHTLGLCRANVKETGNYCSITCAESSLCRPNCTADFGSYAVARSGGLQIPPTTDRGNSFNPAWDALD